MVKVLPVTLFAPGRPVSEALRQAWEGVLTALL